VHVTNVPMKNKSGFRNLHSASFWTRNSTSRAKSNAEENWSDPAWLPSRDLKIRWKSVDRMTCPDLLACDSTTRITPLDLASPPALATLAHLSTGKPVVTVSESHLTHSDPGTLPAHSPQAPTHLLVMLHEVAYLHTLRLDPARTEWAGELSSVAYVRNASVPKGGRVRIK
jgi:hypothetical protein